MSNKCMMPVETAQEMCWSSPSDEFDGWTMVAKEEGENRRWAQNITIVVRDSAGELWAFDYDRGLTESQENEYPWGDRYDNPKPTEFEVYSVKPIVKTVTEYVAA